MPPDRHPPAVSPHPPLTLLTLPTQPKPHSLRWLLRLQISPGTAGPGRAPTHTRNIDSSGGHLLRSSHIPTQSLTSTTSRGVVVGGDPAVRVLIAVGLAAEMRWKKQKLMHAIWTVGSPCLQAADTKTRLSGRSFFRGAGGQPSR